MKKPLVGLVMGSNSDWGIMQHAAVQLRNFSFPYETRVISAHLAGVLATKTTLQILGVSVPSKYLKRLDSSLPIVLPELV